MNKLKRKRASAQSIEITPEMIEAGRDPIARRWIDFTGPRGSRLWDEVLCEVFLAMWAARPQSRRE